VGQVVRRDMIPNEQVQCLYRIWNPVLYLRSLFARCYRDKYIFDPRPIRI
jgi:hypothetical protein